MEEYIGKSTAIQICMDSWDASGAAQDIKDEPAAKVIELDSVLKEYKAFIKTNPTSEQIDKWCINTMRKILSDEVLEQNLSETSVRKINSKGCVSRDEIRLKIAEMPKYTEGKKLASTRHLKDFLEKELKNEDPIEITPDICLGFTMALKYIGKFVKELPPTTPVQEVKEDLDEESGIEIDI